MYEHSLKGDWETRRVWLDGQELTPEKSQATRNHSPDGFAWGYGGSGPAQLALAICLKIGCKEHYQTLKWEIISKLPQSNFNIEFDPESLDFNLKDCESR
jgi:hypothetical protein